MITIFVGSSSKNADKAEQFATLLQKTCKPDQSVKVTHWRADGAFPPGSITLLQLEKHAQNSAFAVFLFGDDDYIAPPPPDRNNDKIARFVTRDNVIFELGLFMGSLGHEKVFFLVPKGISKLHIATDLLGVTYLHYDPNAAANDGLLKQSCKMVKSRIDSHVEDYRRTDKCLVRSLQRVQKEVELLTSMHSTRPIGSFPGFFKHDVVSFVEEITRSEREGKGELLIATDFLTYGAFSAEEESDVYLAFLRDRTVPARILIPTEAQRNDLRIKQHKRSGDGDPTSEQLRRYNAFRRRKERSDPETETYEHFFKMMAAYEKDKITIIPGVQEINMNSSLLLWVAPKNQKAIFAVSVDESPGVDAPLEHAFYTENRHLVEALGYIWTQQERHGK